MEGDQHSLLFPGVRGRALHVVDTNGVVAVAGKCSNQQQQFIAAYQAHSMSYCAGLLSEHEATFAWVQGPM